MVMILFPSYPGYGGTCNGCTYEPRSKPLRSCLGRGPLEGRGISKTCARKQNVSTGVSISLFGPGIQDI
jgi:hypothetical protein